MKTGMIATLAGLAVAGSASASFVEFYTVKTQVATGGVNLDQYVLYARFNGPTDTVLNAFNLNGLAGATMNAFYHKDNTPDPVSSVAGVLSTTWGTWNCSQTGSGVANRPYDSHLMIGGLATALNTTNADPSWGAAPSWNRADLPNGQNIGWFNSNPPNLQGRVGQAGNTADSVRLGQFVVARDFDAGSFSITIGFNSGVAGSAVQFADGTFAIGVPTPGAIALLGLAGLAGRRRR